MNETRRAALAGFRITHGTGFHMTFENGWTVSVQFGPGNYCDNYKEPFPYRDERVPEYESTNAECAVWGPDGQFVRWGDWGDDVSNRSTPAEVLELLNWAASQPGD